jgi:hypothetical protein
MKLNVTMLLAVCGVLALLGLALLVFLNLGGWQMLRANRDVANRGFTATEAHAAPGMRRLLLPKGWVRDTLAEYKEDNLASRPQSPGPRTALHMGGPDEAWLHFALGQYSHSAGTITPVSATLYVRAPEAAPWTMADLANGRGRESARLRFLRRQDEVEIYVEANSEAQGPAVPFAVLNDPAKRLRLQLAAGQETYNAEQLIALGVSILRSAEADAGAVSEARRAALAASAKTDSARGRSLEWVQTFFRLERPLAAGLTVLAPGSPAWLSGDTLHTYQRLGAVPAGAEGPQGTVSGLRVDTGRLQALVAAHPGGTPAELRPNDLLALWAEAGEIKIWSLGDGVLQMELRAPHPLYEPLLAALPAGTIGLYRESNLYLPESSRVEAWFRLSAAYQEAQRQTPSLIR